MLCTLKVYKRFPKRLGYFSFYAQVIFTLVLIQDPAMSFMLTLNLQCSYLSSPGAGIQACTTISSLKYS